MDIAEMLSLYLADIPNTKTLKATSGEIALEIVGKESIDLVLLDIMLPKMDGYEVLKKIREKKNIPAIIISAKNEDNETILALNLGADDYITKPFNPLVVVARTKAQLRRISISETEDGIIRIGNLQLNTNTCTLHKSNRKIDLTYTEYNLLKHFMESPRRVYTKQQLYIAVWEEDSISYDNLIMVYISKLREKIEDDPKHPEYLINVRGLGYKFENNQ